MIPKGEAKDERFALEQLKVDIMEDLERTMGKSLARWATHSTIGYVGLTTLRAAAEVQAGDTIPLLIDYEIGS
jgi:hypothetical protein